MLSDEKYKRIKHVSLSPERLKHPAGVAERIFTDLWGKENDRKLGINGGMALLEILLDKEKTLPGSLRLRVPSDITQRDAEVAASVIQWLGTNCGQAFLFTVEKKIGKRDKINRERREKSHQKKQIKWEKQARKRRIQQEKEWRERRIQQEKDTLKKEMEEEKEREEREIIRGENNKKRERLERMRKSREERERENPFAMIILSDLSD